jgi:hypothetical protein
MKPLSLPLDEGAALLSQHGAQRSSLLYVLY